MAIIDNLISYYKLDESAATTAVEDSHGANEATLNENTDVISEAGKINTCFHFDGSANVVTIPDDNTLDITGAFSIQAWVYRDTNNTGDCIIEKGASATQYPRYGIFLEGAPILFFVGNGGYTKLTGSTVGTGAWHHIVCVWEGTGANQAHIYIDGSEDTVGTLSTVPTATDTTLWMGAWRGNSNYFDGLIDEVGVWERALTPDEVTALYNDGNGLAYPFAPPGTNMQINISDVLKDVSEMKINIGGVLKNVVQVKQNIGGVLKDVFG